MSSSGEAGDARACAMMEVATAGGAGECYGVGIDANIVTASIKALISSANRVSAQQMQSKAA
jgi:2-isopropylmalate synthase